MRYHDAEHKNNVINFDVTGQNINRVIVTYGQGTVIISLNAKISEMADILNALFTVARSSKSTYTKWVSHDDAMNIWTEYLPSHLVVTDVKFE